MTIDALINKIADVIINPLILLLFGIALIVFVWGGVQFVRNASNSSERETSIRNLTYGIIGMAIMVSAFGITKFIKASLPASSGSNGSGYTPIDIDSLQSK